MGPQTPVVRRGERAAAPIAEFTAEERPHRSLSDLLAEHRELRLVLADMTDFLGSLVGDEDQYGRSIIDEDDAMLAAAREILARCEAVTA